MLATVNRCGRSHLNSVALQDISLHIVEVEFLNHFRKGVRTEQVLQLQRSSPGGIISLLLLPFK